MYRKLLAAAIAALLTVSATAVPAKPGVFTHVQPDGSTIRLERHGDEFFHWTTIAGTSNVVKEDKDGFWRPATIDARRRMEARQRRAEANRKRMAPRAQENYSMTHGERHIPVLLVAFSDLAFSLENPQQQFNALLNEVGYSANMATGSVRDFYVDNSRGAFVPVFDVYGPVTVPHEMAYYGQNINDSDRQADMALYHAALGLNDVIDFSKYDYDSDGEVDMVLFYYAGYSEAEGGGSDTIWPHQWSIQVSGNYEARNARFDGKKLGRYFCSSELRGRSGNNICGIGTTCHEFAHSLGLPDFYDTDYSDHGETGGLYSFSTMCSGCYNNNSKTPPYFNAEERIMLNWMDEEDLMELPAGDAVLSSVSNNVAYKSFTDTEGEYFVYECRDATGWDRYISGGMVVYHVDKSKGRIVLGMSPYELWEQWEYYNSINCDGNHPCFYVVPSMNQSSLNYSGGSSEMVFPGKGNKTTYTPIDWDNNNTGLTIKKISYSSGTVSLTSEYNIQRKIGGKVTDQYGRPVPGVYVVLSKPASNAPLMKKAPRREKAIETVTGSDGSFLLYINGYEGSKARLNFSRSGYMSTGIDVELEPRLTSVNVVMYSEGESGKTEYSYFDDNNKNYMFGDAMSNSLMAAIRIPASDLPQEGGTLKSITYYPLWPAKAYYLVVDSGQERILTLKLPGRTASEVRYDLEEDEVDFSADKDLYVGIAIEQANVQYGYTGYLFIVTEGADNCHLSNFNLERSNWSGSAGYALKLSATVSKNSDDPGPVEPGINSLAEMGFNSISDPGKGKYEPGTAFALDIDLAPGVTAESVTWTFDGKDVTGAKSVSLDKGHHTITAVLKTTDGGSEVLQLVLDI